MTRVRLTWLFLAGYLSLILMAVGFVFITQPATARLDRLLLFLLPFQALAVCLAVWAVYGLGGWAVNGFGRMRWRGAVWLLPGWLVLAGMYVNILAATGDPLGPDPELLAVALLLGVPLLIAVGEEVMFRGVLLRQSMVRMTVRHAMLLSAVLFGLFHLVNGLLGHGIGGALQQVAFAFLVGFFLAPIALRIDNLWPLIIWHWLWNIAVFASQAADVVQPLVLIGIAIQVAVSGWLWRDIADDAIRP